MERIIQTYSFMPNEYAIGPVSFISAYSVTISFHFTICSCTRTTLSAQVIKHT